MAAAQTRGGGAVISTLASRTTLVASYSSDAVTVAEKICPTDGRFSAFVHDELTTIAWDASAGPDAAGTRIACHPVLYAETFLKCHGRVLNELIGEAKVIHIDALPLYRKYGHVPDGGRSRGGT